MNSITQKILNHIEQKNIKYKYLEHGPAKTCEESALLRNEPMEIGGKTILFKSKNTFHLFVLSASLAVDSKKVRRILRDQKLRFANPEELLDLCQVEKGALPPFGKPIYPYDLYIDESIFKNTRIAFNAGDIRRSVILEMEDYLSLVKFEKVSFSKDSQIKKV